MHLAGTSQPQFPPSPITANPNVNLASKRRYFAFTCVNAEPPDKRRGPPVPRLARRSPSASKRALLEADRRGGGLRFLGLSHGARAPKPRPCFRPDRPPASAPTPLLRLCCAPPPCSRAAALSPSGAPGRRPTSCHATLHCISTQYLL